MKDVLQWIIIVIRMLLFLILLPFVLLWVSVKYCRFRLIMKKQLVQYGMTSEEAWNMSKAVSPFHLLHG